MRDVANPILQDLLVPGNDILTSKVNSLKTSPDVGPVTLNTLVTHPSPTIRNNEGLETMETTKNLGGVALDHQDTALNQQGSTFPQPV